MLNHVLGLGYAVALRLVLSHLEIHESILQTTHPTKDDTSESIRTIVEKFVLVYNLYASTIVRILSEVASPLIRTFSPASSMAASYNSTTARATPAMLATCTRRGLNPPVGLERACPARSSTCAGDLRGASPTHLATCRHRVLCAKQLQCPHQRRQRREQFMRNVSVEGIQLFIGFVRRFSNSLTWATSGASSSG